MIPVDKLIEVFRSMLGWPYATPGSNNASGIDCSGAFVYAYRQFGERIYHGSNRIIREYCTDVRDVRSLSDLQPGMAIFKGRSDLSRMKAEYKPGGRYYRADLPEDYYHVGLVASVRPLEIINATPPRVRINSDLSRWCCAGLLKAVDYSGASAPEVPEAPQTPLKTAVATAPTGNTVNLRREPSMESVVLTRVPIGRPVEVLDDSNPEWWRVRYDGVTGYMMRVFLCG